MPILKYVIDRNYDAKMIFAMLSQNSAYDAKFRAEFMELKSDDINKITKTSKYIDVKELISEIVSKRYSQNVKQITRAKNEYQKAWDKIDGLFFKRLEEISKYPRPHSHYYCVVSAFHKGLSSWGGNKIARIYNEDPHHQLRITAHEIIISYFFSLIYNRYPEIRDNNAIWETAEIFAITLTGLDPVMSTFWPWDKSGAYSDHNYPQIATKQIKFQQIYSESGLNSFIKSALSDN